MQYYITAADHFTCAYSAFTISILFNHRLNWFRDLMQMFAVSFGHGPVLGQTHFLHSL